uniref:Uncharacterized protein n=1 Tax=Tanacetum cinerariifolium TaxID=118510 RepID=A0A699KDZ2_TANCI|nr:hypothetical protein [Tanacetum cinerariifolium]
MQKAKKNMRKFNFKKAIAQKFKEYDQKREALTNFNVSEAFEKDVQAKVLTKINKLLPTHIPNAIANYVKPHLNTSMLELLNRIHLNKLNDTHTTHQQLYDTLYESIILDQDALDAQAVQSSFHKRSHDNHDPPNNREVKNKKKRQKDIGEPSSRSSRRNRSLVVIVQDDTPAMQPLDQAIILIQKHSEPEWCPKKSGLAKRRTTWFDLFLKSDIDKDKNHILGPSTYNNDVELEYHVSQLKAAVLSEAQWKNDKGDVSKPRSFERHMSKSTKPHPCFYNNDYTYLVDLSTEEKYTTSITKHYDAIYYKEGIEDRIPERWSKEVRRYHFESLNGIDQRIPFIMTASHKGAVYLKRYNIKSLMKQSEVKKFSDGTLVKIQENLIDMLSKNKLGRGNKRLKGRDWTDYVVKSSREMLKKIDEVLRHKEQLRRLEEYVGGRDC